MANKLHFNSFQHILKAPNKEYVLQLCNRAILYKDLHPLSYPETIVTDVSSTFSITKGEAKQVIYNLGLFLKQALFFYSSKPESVHSLFPDDFSKDLRDLLINIIARNFSEWKSCIVSHQTSSPRLLGVTWQLDNPVKGIDASEEIHPNTSRCILQLKVEDFSESSSGTSKQVNVMLTREKLNAMLDGLTKIKDQLESVKNR